jgi:hypothetical protein
MFAARSSAVTFAGVLLKFAGLLMRRGPVTALVTMSTRSWFTFASFALAFPRQRRSSGRAKSTNDSTAKNSVWGLRVKDVETTCSLATDGSNRISFVSKGMSKLGVSSGHAGAHRLSRDSTSPPRATIASRTVPLTGWGGKIAI